VAVIDPFSATGANDTMPVLRLCACCVGGMCTTLASFRAQPTARGPYHAAIVLRIDQRSAERVDDVRPAFSQISMSAFFCG